MQFAGKYKRSLSIAKLFLFVGFVWAAIVGPVSSVLILNSIGATSSQIGIFTAACAVISVILQPFWGFLGDKIGSPRKVLCFCVGASSFFFGGVLLTNNLYTAAAFMIMDAVFRCSVVALLDSHTLSEVNAIPGLQYSHIRLAGSFFYGLMSFVYSGIVNARGIMIVIPISVCIAILAVFWGIFVARGQYEIGVKHDNTAHRVKPNVIKEAALLLKNRSYVVFIICAAFSALSMLPLIAFAVYFVTAVGGDSGDVLMILALRCVVELPFFILIGSVGRRITTKKLMLAGMCFTLVYITGLFFADTLFWLIVFNLFGAPGFILCLAGRMRYISETTPITVRSTSITIMAACEISLGSIVGNLIAGFLLESYGTRALALVTLTALIMSMFILSFILPKSSSNS